MYKDIQITETINAKCVTFFVENYHFSNTNLQLLMKVGDKVKVSPDLTGLDNWLEGIVIDVEENKFNGIVISIKADDGRILGGQERFFKPIK